MNAFSKTSVALLPSFLLVLGCGHSGATPPGAGQPSQSAAQDSGHHRHEGWWCDEHGVPEEQCGQCNSQVAADFQKKGDWCADHDRPDSQCFVCHPELEAKFAARYEAKYGKKPPRL
ncbi:MAG TPA: RND transporter [Pirellulales bacterium]|nr:RND transporter [Pirellulales bacterium]